MFLCSLAFEFLVTEIAQPLVHLKQGRSFLKHGDESLRGGEDFMQTTFLRIIKTAPEPAFFATFGYQPG